MIAPKTPQRSMRKRCAVCCRWLQEIDPGKVEELGGHVSGAKLREVIERVIQFNPPNVERE